MTRVSQIFGVNLANTLGAVPGSRSLEIDRKFGFQTSFANHGNTHEY